MASSSGSLKGTVGGSSSSGVGASSSACQSAAEHLRVSIVIPLLNEAESLPELTAWIDRVVGEQSEPRWETEILFIDDGSTDDSWAVIAGLTPEHVQVRGIRFQRNYGKAAALQVGFTAAKGEYIFTMDADLQDSPDELPGMMKKLREEGLDLLSGWKKKRHDPVLSKNLPSKLFNATARAITGIRLHDFNCGLKLYRSIVARSIELYGDMHRYTPVLAKNAGFSRIDERVVTHYPRKYGHTKFGWSRFINGFLDLMTVAFVGKFGKRPMHFFGSMGTFTFLLGGILTVWKIVEKIVMIQRGEPYRQVVDQPLFFLALTLVILGCLFFLCGFLGELIARSAPDRNRYTIAESLNSDGEDRRAMDAGM